jgi:hypothetical protein
MDLFSYEGSDGKTHETCIMRLDNDEKREFELLVSKFFKHVKSKYYFPVVDVVPVAKISSRTGKPYSKQQLVFLPVLFKLKSLFS